MRSLLMTGLVTILLFVSADGAQAQRGGSVRYSGGRSTASVSHTSSTSVSRTSVSRTGGTAWSGGGTVARTTTATAWQAPVATRAVGTTVRALPTGYRAMAVAGTNYYSYGGAYYTTDPTGAYVVVAPPVGASIDVLPAGAVEIVPGVYECNGVKYRPSYDDGHVVYVVSN